MALTTQFMEEFKLFHKYSRDDIKSQLSQENGYQIDGDYINSGSIQVYKNGERFWVMMIGVDHEGTLQTYDHSGNFFWYAEINSKKEWKKLLISECSNHVKKITASDRPPIYLFLRKDKSDRYHYLGEAEPKKMWIDKMNTNAYFYSELLEFKPENQKEFLSLKELLSKEPHNEIKQSILRSQKSFSLDL